MESRFPHLPNVQAASRVIRGPAFGPKVESICPEGRRGDVDRLKTDQTIANVGFIGGGVLAAAGAVMILVGKPSKEETSATASRLDPQVGPGRSGIVATGRF